MPESPGPEFPDGPDFPEFSEDELSSVVFDEDFVRAASVHEPSATERGAAIDPAPTPLTAAPERTDKKAERVERVDWFDDGTYPPDGEDPWRARTVPSEPAPSAPTHVPTWFTGESWVRGRGTRWRRGVAWVLAVLMGVGVVAMAVTAVYRSGSSQSPSTPRQPSVDSGQSAPVVDDDPVLASPAGDDTSRVRITLGPGDPLDDGSGGGISPQPVWTLSEPG